jgi:hypothetical protein
MIDPELISGAGEGFLLGASLIIAIGAQNAFVLRQGLQRQHVFAVATVCALSDAVLIAAGVAGLGTLVGRNPGLLMAIAIVGAAFLVVYGALAGRRVLHPAALRPAGQSGRTLAATLATCLGLTHLPQPARLSRHSRTHRRPVGPPRATGSRRVRDWRSAGVRDLALRFGVRCSAARAAVRATSRVASARRDNRNRDVGNCRPPDLRGDGVGVRRRSPDRPDSLQLPSAP